MTLKKKVEAILFSVGKFISIEEMAKLCRTEEQKIKEVLLSLMADYENNEHSSLVILQDGNSWKMATREEFGHVVRKVVSETELTKSQMETLAVIAFKYPIKQSDLIKIRTNKAYEHLAELEKGSFITRQRYGRSRLIKLTDKFFDYFDLPHEKLKERFKGFEDLAKTIEEKEDKIDKTREELKEVAKEAKEHEEKERKVMEGEIELVDDRGEEHPLEVVEEEPKIEPIKEQLSNLEIVDVEKKENEEKSEDDDSSPVSEVQESDEVPRKDEDPDRET
ncbi:SMC-Scp complex subunit ScpB [Candidatus Woesearchaeota archaeon]|nr:SMC-Scp complex subunit ScpB [Candidatus Woesearchaeota archaeon]